MHAQQHNDKSVWNDTGALKVNKHSQNKLHRKLSGFCGCMRACPGEKRVVLPGGGGGISFKQMVVVLVVSTSAYPTAHACTEVLTELTDSSYLVSEKDSAP